MTKMSNMTGVLGVYLINRDHMIGYFNQSETASSSIAPGEKNNPFAATTYLGIAINKHTYHHNYNSYSLYSPAYISQAYDSLCLTLCTSFFPSMISYHAGSIKLF